MEPGNRPARGEGRQAPDRLVWNLAVFLLIPVLVLLIAAWIAVRRAGERDAAPGRDRPPAPAPAGGTAP